jgi:hypothetical protein
MEKATITFNKKAGRKTGKKIRQIKKKKTNKFSKKVRDDIFNNMS